MLSFSLRDRTITTPRPAFVMGIVNCTPDSFFYASRGGASLALELAEKGADIIDLGAESTRPGSNYVSAEDEIRRLLPVIEEIRKVSDVPVSVDTRKRSVMEAAFSYGADMLNDVSALEDDETMVDFVAEKNLPVILMHKRGTPENMQKNTAYSDVFAEVSRYLEERALFAESRGVSKDKIILDPGVGFGKDYDSNRTLINRCGSLCGGKYPVLMALSRKNCIGEMTNSSVNERLYGTIAANMVAVQSGATFVRVHDVVPALDSLNVMAALSEKR